MPSNKLRRGSVPTSAASGATAPCTTVWPMNLGQVNIQLGRTQIQAGVQVSARSLLLYCNGVSTTGKTVEAY